MALFNKASLRSIAAWCPAVPLNVGGTSLLNRFAAVSTVPIEPLLT
ncbi:hypothetical protein [Hydrogenophaga sp.]|nr:hypothetical protein [Hydrogenophaga sp.]MDP1687899.1 hypothetical protein [Hydrogenophaga sp.]